MKCVTVIDDVRSLPSPFTLPTAGLRMELEAIGGAAALALLGSATYALTARAWIALTRSGAGRRPFSDVLLPEPAERLRKQFDLLGSKQSALLASALTFVLLFAFAWLSGASGILADARAWIVSAVLAIVVAGIAWALYRLLHIVLLRRELAFRRNANIAVGQSLGRVTGNLNRVFHDVECAGECVDHVLVGQRGAYAVFVLARRPGKNKTVRVRDSRLWLAGTESLAMDRFVTIANKLAGLFRKAVGHPVHVRCVLVVPGWEIEGQASDSLLVVNERNLVMLRGWADRSESLLNEDAELLHEFLEDRSLGRLAPKHR